MVVHRWLAAASGPTNLNNGVPSTILEAFIRWSMEAPLYAAIGGAVTNKLKEDPGNCCQEWGVVGGLIGRADRASLLRERISI